MAYLNKATLWGIKKETSYGNAETLAYPADVAELIDPSMDGSIDEIERTVVKNSLVKAESLLGKETSSGTLALEVTSTDGAGKLNGDVLYESAMGVRIAPVAKLVLTVASAGTSTITVNTGKGSDYKVGQGLKIKAGTTTGYVTITGILGDVLSVSPNIVGGSVTEVTGLLSYRLSVPSTPTVSFNVEEYLASDASYIKYKYLGVVANSMSLEFPLADILKASFSVGGAGFSASTTTANNAVCFDLKPHIAKNIQFLYGGSTYDINELTINVENEIYDSETLTRGGINKKFITGKNTVGGSFVVDYDGLDLFNKYKSRTYGSLIFSTSTNDGKKFGGYAPRVALKNVSKSVDSSIYKDNAELQMLSSGTCVNGIEDAFSIWFE